MGENILRERELITELVRINIERFFNFAFLSSQWWLLLAFLIVPWLIWAKVVDKRRKLEILVVGLFIAIITKLLDLVGYNLNFWDYPIELIPLVPEAFAFDLSMIPVAYMLLYQYLRTWKSYCIGLVCMSVVYAFIGEPFCNWIMVVAYIKWRYIYSFVYYIIVGITVRAIVENLKGKTIPYSTTHSCRG
ncbi:CBO0543 family protein [Aneurinibacillus tyrosinisolvens]|uniref:CBO0543 family protein n=1 Tax=Aneurinibacillus tyrosinisolvens TaxID=1443435 RepID=UPI000AE05838|nr:CBO0543 family protein [Aneurinibacillus tyrosinisolvens]